MINQEDEFDPEFWDRIAASRRREAEAKAPQMIAHINAWGRWLIKEKRRRVLERYNRRRQRELRDIQLNRPTDMGGPRGVWLTYFPPPDPRFDNMEPAGPE